MPCEDVIDLADVADGILPRHGLETHGPVWRDQAVRPVAASDLSVVASLGGRPGDSEVDRSRGGIVGGIHMNPAFIEAAVGGQILNLVPDRRRLGQIVIEIGKMPTDHRAGDRQGNRGVAADAHHLDVLAPGGMVRCPRAAVQERLGSENEKLQRGHRRITDTERRIVGQRRLQPAPGRAPEQLSQGARARPQEVVQSNVAVGIEGVQVLAQPGPRSFDRDLVQRDRCLSHDLGRPAGKVDLDRRHDLAAAEAGRGTAAAQQRLVNIVMKDLAKAVEVIPAQISGQCLGKGVAYRIGMAYSLALDDFDELAVHWQR